MRGLLGRQGAAPALLLAAGLALSGMLVVQGELVRAAGVATRVLGQAEFTTSDCVAPPTAATLCTPSGVLLDPASGRLFVADADNNRVVSWADAATFGSGSPADQVLGQAGFESDECVDPPNPGSMCTPTAIAIAPGGRLFVVDSDNSRVLSWPNVAALGNGQQADRVLGQRNFSANECADTASAATLCNPTGVAVDPSGRLFVSDSGNSRVLSWPNANAISNGQNADRVLGQRNFRDTDCADDPGAATLCNPRGIAIDPSGRLFVADTDNSRVLSWATASTVANGQPADRVLGQTDFRGADCNGIGLSEASLCSPQDVTVGSNGRLFVADSDNNRVLSWANAASINTGQPADLVLGQPDGISLDCADPPNEQSMCSPTGVAVDAAGRLYIGDANNNRVLVYE